MTTRRTTLFTLYGILIGFAYSAIVAIVFPLSIIVTITLSSVVMAAFSYYSDHLAKDSQMSNWQFAFLLPLIPFAMLGGILGIGFFFCIIGAAVPFFTIEGIWKAHQFHKSMKSKGRFIALLELEPRLIAGKGTLIEEMGNKGPYRIWWTEDDLFSLGSPVSTQEEFVSVLTGKEHEFNSRCLREYFDEETGKAMLTPIPPRHAVSGRLALMFPAARIAKIVRPL